MPTPRKHASHAARQAEYRKRSERARQAALVGKVLPPMPAIATMPGWARWNASIAAAQAIIADTLSEMQGYFDDRSESWQESARGDDHTERVEAVERAQDALNELSW